MAAAVAAEQARVVVVTGVSRGIGLAVARDLLARGACVVGVSRTAPQPPPQPLSSTSSAVATDDPDAAAFAALAAEHGADSQQGRRRFVHVATDARDVSAAASATVAAARAAFARIDAVVFNAGTLAPIARLADADPAAFADAMAVNVTSVVALAAEALPLLRDAPGGGRMVFVSSGAAVNPYAGWGAYCASKAALNMLCAVYGREEPSVVSVAVRPGVVATRMQAEIRDPQNAAAMTPSKHADFVRLHRDGDLLPPERPARVLAALALGAPPSLSGRFFSWNDPALGEAVPELAAA